MNIPEFSEIIEPNDQTEARREHLEKLRVIVGNVYPNKFERSRATGEEDTISRIVDFEPVKNLVAEIKNTEKNSPEQIEELKGKLKEFKVRVAGRLAVPPRVMGKAAFVHLSDGIERLQIYVRRDEVQGIYNGIEPQRREGAEIEENSTANDGENLKSKIENPKSVSGWEVFNLLDHGDFVGVGGFLFVTKTGELSVHVETIQFLSKAMLPMPNKMHGIEDAEIKQRQRYADLIASSLRIKSDEEIEAERASGNRELTTREVFEIRSKIIREMRRFLDEHGYIEVETPMLTPKATGAAAKPFETHHNALDIPLYARIAPELYLKRLLVGGFEKVYELNRNFRNEGISTRHNPEFTMLEFYCAYMDVSGMMDFCEKMLQESVRKATGSLRVKYGWAEIDFSKFERLTMKEAIHKELSFNIEAQQRQIDEGENPEDFFMTFSDLIGEKYDIFWLDNPQKLRTIAAMGEKNNEHHDVHKRDYKSVGRLVSISREERREHRKQTINETKQLWQEAVAETQNNFDASKNQTEQAVRDLVYIFEEMVEDKLTQPTFIVDYPKSISPLSKASPENPNVAERFELFIAGMECANGFSELNDPREQYERFRDQMNERMRGDEEAMILDEDYIRALSYGMPPAAGIGIGIDRLVMLLTNRQSIRDVILFPHLRPERKSLTAEDAENAEES